LSVVARLTGNVPHLEQLFAPLSDNEPAGQAEQDLAPVEE
jgi:hypothetical protein